MNKTLAVAILLFGVLAISFGTNNSVNPQTFPGPHVVATTTVINQTTAIPTTTIFTPQHTGLYRISSYMATTTPGTLDSGYWVLWLGWTDEAGAEIMAPLELRGVVVAPYDYGFTPSIGDANAFPGGGSSFVVRAIAGTPVTYAVTNGGTNGTYEVFLVVERLE
jgi:hypothetical protein